MSDDLKLVQKLEEETAIKLERLFLGLVEKLSFTGFDVNRRFLEKEYPNIKGFYPLSCASGKGMDEFSKDLKQAVNSVEIKSTFFSIPGRWRRAV